MAKTDKRGITLKALTLGLILVLNLVKTPSAYGQWVRTLGPYNDPVGALSVIDTTLLVGEGLQANRTTDAGTTWENGSLSGFPDAIAGEVHAFAWVGTILFEGTDVGVFGSTDSGRTWQYSEDKGLGLGGTSLAASGTILFAGTKSGVFRSFDGDASWSPM